MVSQARILIGDSRSMDELEDEGVDLIITSPPYWHIKDYGVKGQVGYGQTLHEYLKDLYLVWKECHRVLAHGRRLCINIGDQFARATVYGRYKIIPLHAELITQCEDIGFDFMGSIIWQKRTTMRTSGGATVMGSYPYPPSGLVEIDYEHILIFKKPGKGRKVPADIKKGSRLSKDEWKEYFQGHWRFGGARQIGHEAMFPEELPRRLIKMFSFVGETVLDPFIGSGTTAKVALSLKRDAVGYEINKEFVDIIKEKVGSKVNVRTRRKRTRPPKVDYVPGIQDARPESPGRASKTPGETFKVTEVIDHRTLGLSSGRKVKLLGVKVKKAKRKQAVTYLKDRVLKKTIFLRFDQDGSDEAYIYLKNRIFVNSYLIRSGLADPDMSKDFSKKARFAKLKRDRTRELKK